MPSPNTIHEMKEKVDQGLSSARQMVEGNKDLLKVLDNLEFTFEHIASNLIIVASAISSMKYRNKGQVERLLNSYQVLFSKRIKEQINQAFSPDLSGVEQ